MKLLANEPPRVLNVHKLIASTAYTCPRALSPTISRHMGGGRGLQANYVFRLPAYVR
jgi:hypothetical protein